MPETISHRDIEFKAFMLWEQDGKPSGIDSNHYWNLALRALTPEIQLALQAELPEHIVCRPGDKQYGFFYYLKLFATELLFAKGSLAADCNYVLFNPLVDDEQSFDLNQPIMLDKLLITLETWAAMERRHRRTVEEAHLIMASARTTS